MGIELGPTTHHSGAYTMGLDHVPRVAADLVMSCTIDTAAQHGY